MTIVVFYGKRFTTIVVLIVAAHHVVSLVPSEPNDVTAKENLDLNPLQQPPTLVQLPDTDKENLDLNHLQQPPRLVQLPDTENKFEGEIPR